MAFIKFKAITRKYNFYNTIATEDLPSYVFDYIEKNEKILAVYKTFKDRSIFTDKKLILFDIGFLGDKKVDCIPYNAITSCSIKFGLSAALIKVFLNNGYYFELRFLKQTGDNKKQIRILYNHIINTFVNNGYNKTLK